MKLRLGLVLLVPLSLYGCGDDGGGEDGAASDSAGSTAELTSGPADSGTTAGTPGTTAGDATGNATGQADSSSGGDPMGNPSPGCGGDPGAIPATLTIQGEERDFFFVLPDDYDPQQAYPLVFAWHARGTSGALAQVYYLVEESANGQAIFVYPDGLPLASQGGQTGWDLSPDGYDMEFFDELYAQLTGNLCIDLDRVFSTGHSFGGFMSNAVGCFRGDHFRAIAPVAGGGPFGGTCDGPVAAWIAHGTEDSTVPFESGVDTYNQWRALNGCGDAGVPTSPEQCIVHEDCEAGYPVVWCEHSEEQPLDGHGWPGWAGPAIWEFFASF